MTLSIGDRVRKTSHFYGWVVAVFTKRNGAMRVVVENEDGILHILSMPGLSLADEEAPRPVRHTTAEGGTSYRDSVVTPERYLP
jgi:hypothetical protein